jgi:hypothetical protein
MWAYEGVSVAASGIAEAASEFGNGFATGFLKPVPGTFLFSGGGQGLIGGIRVYNGLMAAESGTSTIAQNAAAGRAFEQQGLNYLQGVNSDVAGQVSVRPFTECGDLTNFRVRLDALGTDNAGNINLYDFKSSPTAGFTPNQQVGYPLLQQFGGQVVGGNGGLAYPAGTLIPPTPVTILRPGSF